MDKIQNVKQLKKFYESLQSLYNKQSAKVIVFESDNLAKRVAESGFSKIGYSSLVKVGSGKELLEEIVKHPGSVVVWYELSPRDPMVEPLFKIVQAMRQQKEVKMMFSAQPEDKLSMARVISQNERNIFLKPLESKNFETKLENFLK